MAGFIPASGVGDDLGGYKTRPYGDVGEIANPKRDPSSTVKNQHDDSEFELSRLSRIILQSDFCLLHLERTRLELRD